MKQLLFCFTALTAAALSGVSAAGVPVQKIGNSCPTGTYTTRDICVPTGNTLVFITDGGCPVGWTKSARYYCVK
jgi:hypothetical protein